VKAERADWAASAPWSGLQDKPAYLTPAGIPYSAVIGAPDIPTPDGLAKVAYTGKYADLLDKPALGTAAYSPVGDFATAEQGELADTALQEDLTGRTITGGIFTPQTVNRLIAGVQVLVGPGAVNPALLTTQVESAGAGDALTLADGTVGDIKTIAHTVAGGTAVLTPTTAQGFTTITFTNAGETAVLQFFSTGWVILSLRGAVAA
jgi:hypothetical protein